MKITRLPKALGFNAGNVKSGDIVVRSPSDGDVIGRLKSDTPAQVRAKIGRAADAFKEWREVPGPRRGELVRLLGEELRAHKDALGELVSVERSEEHTSELQSLMRISYAVFCLKKKKKQHQKREHHKRTQHYQLMPLHHTRHTAIHT